MVDLRQLFKMTYTPVTLFVQSMGTCFLVQSPAMYYRPSPLCSSLFCLIPLGFPNVTMAPNCDLESSQGPIVQKCDPPTQLSILSQSVMNSQVMYILFHACPVAFFVSTKQEYSKVEFPSRPKPVLCVLYSVLITYIEHGVKWG